MSKTAFVFAGQGAQYSGMGRELCESSPAARKIFNIADAYRADTSKQCFEGSDEELTETQNTQPCVFCTDIAAAAALEEAGIKADAAAGFSLGELAALTFAEMLDYASGFEAVCLRGKFMQEAASGKMFAVLKLDSKTVENICVKFDGIYPVNYNSPKQTVVAVLAEDESAVRFCAEVKARGGIAVQLAVSGAFHSPAMHDAAEKMKKVFSEKRLRAGKIPVYANLTAKPYGTATEEICDTAARQTESPVLWQKTVENMISDGIETFIEVGPGKTLSGLIEKTVRSMENSPQIGIFNVCDSETLNKTIKAVKSDER